jgi:hypothetical protein
MTVATLPTDFSNEFGRAVKVWPSFGTNRRVAGQSVGGSEFRDLIERPYRILEGFSYFP